jgi:hypothetical protein
LALTDVAGVLSRKFIVGFFIPTFFGCLALKLLVADQAVPRALREASSGAQILILGGVALLLGLFLWGVHYSLIRVLEGYWLIALPNGARPHGDPASRWSRSRILRLVRWTYRVPFRLLSRLRRGFGEWKRQRWVRARAQLTEIKKQKERSPERTQAVRQLTERFPPEDRLVLPTELGNVIRAFENHPRERYGLDGIPVWPLVVTMLSEGERSELEETTTDVAFWLNSLVVVVVAGSVLFAERLWHPPGDSIETALIELAIAAAVIGMVTWMYRQLIGAAIGWGKPVRAGFDVHRLELYDRVGVKRPHTREDDVAAGKAVNRMLAFAEPIPLRWRATPPGTPTDSDEKHRQSVPVAVWLIALAVVAGHLPGVRRFLTRVTG